MMAKHRRQATSSHSSKKPDCGAFPAGTSRLHGSRFVLSDLADANRPTRLAPPIVIFTSFPTSSTYIDNSYDHNIYIYIHVYLYI